MAKTKTSTAVKDRYNTKTYDRLFVRVPKGDKDRISVAADDAGMSLNSYVQEAINEKMKRGI